MSLSRNKQEELDIYMAILGMTEILTNLVSKPEYLKKLIVDANGLNAAEQKKYDDAAITVANAKAITDDANAKLSEAKDALDKARIQNEQNKNTADELSKLRVETQKSSQDTFAKNNEATRLRSEALALKQEYEGKIKEADAKLAESSALLESARAYDADIRDKAQKIKLAADGL